MEIVIKITEHEWEYLNKLVKNEDILGHYERLLVNGTPLPKGHGRLIDADERRTEIDDKDKWVVDLAETIIPADKESEVEE